MSQMTLLRINLYLELRRRGREGKRRRKLSKSSGREHKEK